MGHYFINDENLVSNIQEFSVSIQNCLFHFKTDNGVFSKKELDFGSKLLIETVLKENIQGEVLDLGCGYGAIGIIISKLKNCLVDMIDLNKRALYLANLNSVANKCLKTNVFYSDSFSLVKKKYDVIISNPPIRIGKVKLYNIFRDAKNFLKENGIIYLVIRKEQGAKSFMKDFSKLYRIEVLNKRKGFYIISLKCCWLLKEIMLLI